MKNYLKPSKPTKERIVRLLVAFALEVASFAVCLTLIKIKDLGPLIQGSVDVSGEMTSPTVGRLVYCIGSFCLAVGLVILSDRFDKAEKNELSFGLSFASGVLLWQSLGETVWHFSVGGTNFVRLECQQSLPIFVVFVIFLFLYGFSKNKCFALWTCILSFALNYLGHYTTLGIYPFLSGCADWKTYCITASCVVGIIAIIAGAYLSLFCKNGKKNTYLLSMLIFIGVSVIFFGITKS